MWQVKEKTHGAHAYDITLTLGFDDRQKCRLRAMSDCGNEIGIFLERGEQLRDGDLLKTTDGRIVLVKAAIEPLSTVGCNDPWMLARAAYHLGNRHVPLQIMPDALRYQRDYVLDDMVRQLGLDVHHVEAGFEPEKGAYHHSHSPLDALKRPAPFLQVT